MTSPNEESIITMILGSSKRFLFCDTGPFGQTKCQFEPVNTVQCAWITFENRFDNYDIYVHVDKDSEGI